VPETPAAALYSIVIPTYDRPRALRGCLEAITELRWSGPPPEVIVVDDGTEPPCRPVAEEFSSRLRIVYDHQPNGGVAVARNRGLRLAQGDFVGFAADDHRLPSDYLEVLDRFFGEHPEAQVVSLNLSSSGPSPMRVVQGLYLRLALGQCYRVGGSKLGWVASTTLPASRAAMFRRAVFEQVGPFDESLRVGEDGEMGRRLAAHGIPVHLLLRTYVVHQEERTALDYLRQRIRYGRSFVRVLGGGDARPTLERLSLVGVPVCATRKMRQWWTVARDIGETARYLALAPLLHLFLCVFYLGSWQELRAERRR